MNDTRIIDEDGEIVQLPTRKEVCPRCHGEGTHVNPNIDGHGLSPHDEDLDDDPGAGRRHLRHHRAALRLTGAAAAGPGSSGCWRWTRSAASAASR